MVLEKQQVIDDALEAIGFFGIERSFDSLCQRIESMAIAAGSKEEGDGYNHFEAFPSYIPLTSSKLKVPHVLAIDIGGTNTRVGLRVVQNMETRWYHVLETRNDDFEQHADEVSGSSFDKYALLLCQNIAEALSKIGVAPESINACGVIWSNAMSNKRVDYGVTGVVEQRDLYQKGEWFIQDIQDGTDLGAVFRRALTAAQINTETLVVSNDTAFTLTATDNADAGMVASTGLNGTVAKTLSELGLGESEDLVICNGEIGGRVLVEDSVLSKADLTRGRERTTLESLTSGKFLPEVFLASIEYLAAHGVEEFAPVIEFLESKGDEKIRVFRSRHISALLEDDRERMRLERPEVFEFPEALPLLEALALRVVERSAKLCAIVAYATVANRLDQADVFKVALDSRLARAISFFRELMQSTLQSITPDHVAIEVELLHGLDGEGGRITVPMQGAANAVDRVYYAV